MEKQVHFERVLKVDFHLEIRRDENKNYAQNDVALSER